MEIIIHRRNSIKSLISTPIKYGVEVDIRSENKILIISHDAFNTGEKFEEWLKYYNHGTLILNVKEEGLEKRLLELLKKYKISNYFFLDQSFPFIYKTAKGGEQNIAVRISEFESIQTALSLRNMVKWLWIDYFTKFPLNKEQVKSLQDNSFKLCIVSPELQGYSSEHISYLKSKLNKDSIEIDAVCTKFPSLWI